jgi:trk system potassium uptake protein
MLSRLGELPLLVLLIGVAALAMLVPVVFGWTIGETEAAQKFLFGAAIFAVVFALMAFATANYRPRHRAVGHLASLVLAYLLLPLVLAVPFAEAVPDTRFLNAYVEMVSALTTTGATLFDQAERLPDTVHLWRVLVGWLGGFLVWVTAVAILAPLNLGGFEVRAAGLSDSRATWQVGTQDGGGAEQAHRMRRYVRRLAPIYCALTLALAVVLMIAGDPPFLAVSHAMSTLATSGISPGDGPATAPSGLLGEVAIFAFLIFALSRQTFSRDVLGGDATQLLGDPELRMAAALIVVVPLALFLRHWLGALEVDAQQNLGWALAALWGGIFTVMSFLTTTGFESATWGAARNWSGLATPGLILMGLALVGGGVATTAGGVKLLRVYALYKHGLREMERLAIPASVGGDGPIARRMRRHGAYYAWIFFMIFAISIAAVMIALSLTGLEFEPAMVLTIASLSTTGPLANVAAETPISYATLAPSAKAILCGAMILGRLETLALIALLNPEYWRG